MVIQNPTVSANFAISVILLNLLSSVRSTSAIIKNHTEVMTHNYTANHRLFGSGKGTRHKEGQR